MDAIGILKKYRIRHEKEEMMKTHIYLIFTTVIIGTLILSACEPVNVAQSKLVRSADPKVKAADLDHLVDGNTAFAFDLYQAVRYTTGNVVYSPYSISLAFAMVYGGARSETATQIADLFHYDNSGNQFHSSFNALDLDLAHRSEQTTNGDAEEGFQLSIANSLWGQDGWTFLQEYLDLLAINYGAGMRLVDFTGAPDNARKQINNWVSDQTKGRIKDIIPPGTLDSLTRLVLANAIYFKATWEYTFDAKKTSSQPFQLLSGEMVNVPMMKMKYGEDFAYASGDGWQAISLP
jgi:serpin B